MDFDRTLWKAKVLRNKETCLFKLGRHWCSIVWWREFGTMYGIGEAGYEWGRCRYEKEEGLVNGTVFKVLDLGDLPYELAILDRRPTEYILVFLGGFVRLLCESSATPIILRRLYGVDDGNRT